jgi:hypothetical protein
MNSSELKGAENPRKKKVKTLKGKIVELCVCVLKKG